MIMGNFLRNRKSIRDFKSRSVEFETIEEIKEDLRTLENEEGGNKFAFRLYENGARLVEKLSGKGGYTGVIQL